MTAQSLGPPNEVGPRDTTPEGTDNIITSTPTEKQEAASDLSDIRRQCTSSRQVNWWTVHTFVASMLTAVDSWPTAGTAAWCLLGDDDPVKWAALLDAAQHWALRLETCQQAHCDASREVSDAVDWSAVAREINDRTDFYAARPWLRRVAS